MQPAREKIRSEAESQRDLMQAMDDLSRNMALLTEESLGGTQAAREAFEKSAKQAMGVIRTANEEVTRAATVAHQVAKSTRGLRLTMLLTMLGAGMMAGAVFLTVLLISQPQLIQSLWRVSHALSPRP
jgi:hypothetical protein